MRGLLENLRIVLGKRQTCLTALTIAIVVILAAPKAYERFHRPDAEKILQSVVVVESDGKLFGSGAVLHGGHYVLTVNHVIEVILKAKKPIVIRLRNGTRLVASLVKRNRHFDIALLELPQDVVGGLKVISESGLKQGDKVRAFGHPFGFTWMVSEGIVSKKSYFPPDEDGEEFVVWTTAWIEGGSSGGPLVNNNGEIVGLVMAFSNPRGLKLGAQHLNLCVSGSEILRFLEND